MQEKVSIMSVWYGQKNPSLEITVWHHSASLVMPINDPRDRFFYPYHTPMKDYKYLSCVYGVDRKMSRESLIGITSLPSDAEQ